MTLRTAVPSLVAILSTVLLACSPAAPAPVSQSAPPAAPTTAAAAPKPTSAPAPAAAAPKPTSAPAAAAAAKPTAAAAATQPAAAAAAPKPTSAPAAVTGQAVTLPKPELATLKIGTSSQEPAVLAVRFADDLGLYKKYGFDSVDITFFDGPARATQGLAAGQVDMIVNTGGPVLASQATDIPMVMIAMYMTRLTDDLVSSSGVTSAQDLKGKSVAISQFGGDSHASALLALEQLQLTENDVTIQQVGGQAARVAALTAGSVAAGVVDMRSESDMRQLGFNVLVRLSDTPAELPRSGIVVSREWLEKNPNAALAIVAANLEAQQRLFSETDKAAESLASWTQTDRADAQRLLVQQLPVLRRDMRWSNAAWEAQREVQSRVDQAMKDIDLTGAYTFEVLDKLKAAGFNDAVGVPKD